MGDRDGRTPFEGRGGRGGRHWGSGNRNNDRGGYQSGGSYHSGGSGRRGYDQQNGSGGYKRKRFEPEPLSEELQLLQRLLILGDRRQQASGPLEGHIRETARLLKRHTVLRAAQLQDDIVECCVQLGVKVEVYAALIALLNSDDAAFAEGLLRHAAAQFDAAWAALDKSRATLLLRLFAALSVVNVVSSAAVMAALCTVVQGALDIAQGPQGVQKDASGRSWQPFTDALVESALLALPWGGSDLWEGSPELREQLQQKVQAYMEARPRSRQMGLCPFFEAQGEDDIPASSDEAAASFLPDLWAAIQDCQAEQRWEELSVPSVHEPLEQDLLEGKTHGLPVLTIPSAVPNMDASAPLDEQAAWLLEALPPRGIIRLLSSERTLGDRPMLARIVGEQYILETLKYWEADRRQCTIRLAKELPIQYPYEDLLAEVLFSQMLRSPRSPMNPLGYGSIIVDFIQQFLPTFARSLSACVRECFLRCNTMYPELLDRLAQWLAFHLSNLQYTWPWAKWQHVLEAPSVDKQRMFCATVLSYLVRLAYLDLIHDIIPEEFAVLLPPAPLPSPLEAPLRGDQEAEQEEEEEEEEEPDAHTLLARQLLTKIREKVPCSGVEAWLQEGEQVAAVGGLQGVLRSLLRALLVGGSKSFTHMVVLLERYYMLLNKFVQEAGAEGELALLDTAAAVWSSSSQRTVMAVDRLLALRLVSAHSVLHWTFEQSLGMRSLGNYVAIQTSYEVLQCALAKTVARTQDAQEDANAASKALANAQETAAQAAAKLEAAQTDANAAVQPAATNGVEAMQADTVEAGGEAGTENALDDAPAAPAQAASADQVAQLQRSKTAADSRVEKAEQELADKTAQYESRVQQEKDIMITLACNFATLLAKPVDSVLVDLPGLPDEGELSQEEEDEDMNPVDAGDPKAAEGTEGGRSAGPRGGRSNREEDRARAIEAWRKATLARCMGLLRQYHVQVAAVAAEVKGAFAEADAAVQEAVLLMLTL